MSKEAEEALRILQDASGKWSAASKGFTFPVSFESREEAVAFLRRLEDLKQRGIVMAQIEATFVGEPVQENTAQASFSLTEQERIALNVIR